MTGTALLCCLELAASLAAAGPAPRPRPSPQRRCPFCHQTLEAGGARARCGSCGTAHHRACWDDHGRCSVFGCNSPDRAATGGAQPAEGGPVEGLAEAACRVEAATSAPATCAPPTSEPATCAPATSEPATSEPARAPAATTPAG